MALGISSYNPYLSLYSLLQESKRILPIYSAANDVIDDPAPTRPVRNPKRRRGNRSIGDAFIVAVSKFGPEWQQGYA